MYYTSRIDFATPEYDEAVALRTEVLRKPLGLTFTEEDLAKEYDSIHLATYHRESHELVGILILEKKDDTVVKMRQVAVAFHCQGKGVGKHMVEYSERVARQEGYTTMTLHARDTAIPFYLSLQYAAVGEPFYEVGILHSAMQKTLID